MSIHDLVATIREWAPGHAPKVGLVLGSGLGGLAEAVEGAVRVAYADLPGFPRSTVSGHKGELVLGRLAGVPVAVLAGRSHVYEHGRADAMDVPVAVLKGLGAETLILTNAAGSLREDAGPGMPVLICDHINLTPANPLIGRAGDEKFVSMVDAYDPSLRHLARRVAAERGIDLPEGVYMWFSGPSFETPAEIRAARALGADLVGMSTVPEVVLARYHGLKVLALSMVTNLAAGMTGKALSHAETKAEAAKGAERFRALLLGILAAMGEDRA